MLNEIITGNLFILAISIYILLFTKKIIAVSMRNFDWFPPKKYSAIYEKCLYTIIRFLGFFGVGVSIYELIKFLIWK